MRSMTKVYAGLGSNLGNKRENIIKAIDRLDACEGICVKEKSVFTTPLLLAAHYNLIMLTVS